MTRPLRIQYPGAFYHITNRGNERKSVFRDDADRSQFLKILAQSKDNYQAVIHGFVLMTNHYHLLVETPLGNLAEFMRYFNITYTSHFNRRHNRIGHLFQGRYKSVLVDKNSYLFAVSKYIHLNPVKVRGFRTKSLAERMKYLLDYKWSSLPGFIDPGKRHEFVDYDIVLGMFGGDTKLGRKNYQEQLFEDLPKKASIKKQVVGQSILGDVRFITWVKETFLDVPKNREQPAVAKLHSYLSTDKLIEKIATATNKPVDEVLHARGEARQLAMSFLYRFGGLKNKEISELMGIDYSTVSQGRKRLTEKRAKNKSLDKIMTGIEADLSRIKI